ncbi:TIGR04283 family arsenosugar biosynthesis glycosyltransferase [Tateyamaria sp. SN6-1]|uniref:TIGR04283 family arsenosugar biosynthesis glycosyltransferase n=1 Tax=Tateyamaria sp. SN6-1 TaxID=3092148 RepID=UPI0039F48BD3
MPAPISVIIPTLNSVACLSGTLDSLVEGLDTGLIAELIVSDGGSTDDTCTLADAWGAQVLHGTASRGGQIRRGCDAARGQWFLILHSDTQLSPGWSSAVAAHLATQDAGYFRLAFDRGGRAVAGWANLRARWFGLPYGDQGLLLPRRLHDAVGGFQDVPLMEDVAMARALRGRLHRLDAVATTSAERYRKRGWLRQGARNLWLLTRYLCGADPKGLAAAYRR